MAGNPIDSEEKAARARAALGDESGKHSEAFMRQVAADLRAWEADHPPASDPNPDELDADGNPIARKPHETMLEPIKIQGRAARAPQDAGALSAFGRGVGQGASLKFGDEMGGFGGWLQSHLPGGEGDIPRATGRGIGAPVSGATDYEVGRDAERQANADAQATHGTAYGAGEVTGGVAPAVALGAGPGALAARGGASLAPSLGGNIISGARTMMALGGTARAGASEAATPEGVLNDAASGTGTDALVGGALPIAGAGLKGTGTLARKFADYLRGVSAGGGGMPVAEAAAYGREVNAALPRSELSLPRSTHGWEEAAGKEASKVGREQLGPMRQAATDAGKGVEHADVIAKLEEQRLEALKDNTKTGKIKAREIASEIIALQNGNEAVAGKGAPLPVDAMGPSAAPMSVNDLSERAILLRGPTEGGFPARGEARTMNTDTNVAGKLAKREMASGYSRLEDQAANNPALRAAKDRFGQLADVQNQAHAGGHSPSGMPHSMHQAVMRAANELGATDAAAKGAYATASALKGVGSAVDPGATMAARSASPALSERASTRESDQAVDDPVYGSLIGSRPAGVQRDVAYSHALMTDPAFRGRMRDRAAKRQEATE